MMYVVCGLAILPCTTQEDPNIYVPLRVEVSQIVPSEVTVLQSFLCLVRFALLIIECSCYIFISDSSGFTNAIYFFRVGKYN